MPFRLGTRIALAQGTLVAAVTAAGSYVFLIAAEKSLDAEMTARTRVVASLATLQLDGSWSAHWASATARAIADAKLAEVARVANASRIVVLDSEGRVLATSDPRIPHGEPFAGLALDASEVARARAEGWAASAPYRHDGRWYQSAWVPVGGDAVLGAELAVVWREGLEKLRRAVWLFAGAAVLLGAVIGAGIARGITRPVARLADAMKQAGPDGLPPAAGVRGEDEVGELGERFDELVAALRRHDAELRALSGTVAHEVRNPLGAMNGWAELIARRAPDEETRRMTEGIREEIAALERLVGRFLTFAGDRKIERIPADLQGLVDDAIRVGVPNVDVKRAVGSVQIACDPDGLREVFVNLLRNAAQATEGRGTVEVLAREAADGAVEIRFRDDGPGIPDEVKERLFQPFATTKADGTGLGLAISKRIVAAHGGTLTYETGRGGTTFVVRIPKGDAGSPRRVRA